MPNLIRLAFAAIAAFAIHPLAESAPQWTEVARTESDRFYVDTTTVQRQGNVVSFWTHEVHLKPEGEQLPASSKHHITSCVTGESTIRTIVDYDAQGKLIATYDASKVPNINQISPGSVSYDVLKVLCKGRANK